MNFEGILTTEGPDVLVRRRRGRQHERHRLRLPGAAGRASSTRSRRARRSSRARWRSTTVLHAILTKDFSYDERRGDRPGDPRRRPDDQDDDDLRLHVRRRPALRRDARGRRARRHERRARRGRRDRQLAHRASTSARARPTAPTSARCAGRSSRRRRSAARCSWPSAPARRCTSCTWPPAAAVEALAEGRARGPAVLRRDAERVPQLHPGRPLGRVARSRSTGRPTTRAGCSSTTTRRRSSGPTATPAGRRSPTAASRSWPPTTRSSSLKDRFETMGTTVDNMQAGQAAVELRVPLLYRGRGKGPLQREPLGRADLGEPGASSWACGRARASCGGRRRRHRGLRPEQAAGPCAGRTCT